MEIKLHEISVRELVAGYVNNKEQGVKAYGGLLDVRPPYQREFVYKADKRDAVISSVMSGFPLNTMYWMCRGDGTYEIIDGQQRTISLCEYAEGNFAVDKQYIHNLPSDTRDRFLDYRLMVYLCSGTESERLAWFRTINIAGERLTEQELRNAVYTSAWLNDAREWFSRQNCQARNIGDRYLAGSCIRQEYLETVLRWMAARDGISIEELMGRSSKTEQNAGLLWAYFRSVIDWAANTFTHYRKEMKGVEWGILYNEFHDRQLNPVAVEAEVHRLMEDSDVSKKKGIYRYIFTHDEHDLDIRAFDQNTRREAYERQGGICALCGRHFELDQMEADHIRPWADGGHTTADNCQMLCRDCNRRKSDK